MLRKLFRFTKNWYCVKAYASCLCLFLICFEICLAQDPQTKVNIQLLGPEQGLPSRNIRSLAQDGRGFMWVATGQDLWRYDGYSFQNFTSFIRRSIGGGTLINQIRKGPKGDIWVVHNSGITIVDPSSLTCTTFDPSSILKGTRSSQNLDVFFDHNQNAWVAIPHGKLIKISKEFVPVHVYAPPVSSVAVESQVTKFFVDQQNRKYAFNDSTFLDEIDERANLIHRVNLFGKDIDALHHRIFSVVQTDPGKIKIYYEHKLSKKIRVRQYHPRTRSFGALTGIDMPIAPDFIYAVNESYVWYKSSKVIGFLNKKTGQFTNLTARLLQKSGASTFFFGAYLSADGSFWIACVDGLFKVTLTEEIFRKYLSVPLEKPGDIGSSIRGITEDSTGKIWACSYGYHDSGLVYMFHQIDPLKNRDRHMILHRPGILGDHVIPYKVLFAGGQVYAITDGTKFIRIDTDAEEFYPVEFPFVSGRGFTTFYKLNEDTFWVGTWGGMGMIDTRALKPVLFNDKAGRYIKNERVNHFMSWKENRIVASTTNGIYILNRDASIYEHYGQSPGDRIKLPALQIFHTTWYDEALWAATGQGLMRVDVMNRKTQLFTTLDGLPDNNIYAALPDKRGNLWLSTNKGLSRFDTRTRKFHNYGIAEGLPHLEFNHGSYLKAADGTLYFGGLNGIVAFNPSQLDLGSKKESALQLISFSKYDADRNRTDTITTHEADQRIVFNPGDRLFTFAFMSPDYQNAGLNRFRYKLEGWGDDNWQLFENGNKLLFNSLPAGNYTLKVQVSVAGSDWSSQLWQSEIEVLAPWYKSVWFYVLSVFAAGFVMYLFYRYRLAQLLQIQKLRNGISADMHDEIGGTLSSITFYSQALLMQVEKTEHREVIRKIKENAQQVQEGLSDIVWSVKAGKDEIEDVFARMFQFGSTLSESKGFVFRFETDKHIQHIKLDMQMRKNLYLIFKEAVNNAAKYADASMITVHTSQENGKIKMTIKDNGKGFEQQLARKGNGLMNMQKRAAQMKGQLVIHSEAGDGTLITLLFHPGKR